MADSGDFVVVWTSGYYGDVTTQDGSGPGIFGRQFAADGTPTSGDFQVNAFTTYGQYGPSIATRPNGDFVVVWYSAGGEDGSGLTVLGRRFASSGAPLGSDFQVNTYTTRNQAVPSVASRANGDFVVAWQSRGQDPLGQDGSFRGVFGQRFDRFGNAAGTEFQVNTYTTGDQVNPRVVSRPNGDFVVAWQSAPQPNPAGSVGQDGSRAGVFGQQFGASGTPQGAEFQINTYTTGNQKPTGRLRLEAQRRLHRGRGRSARARRELPAASSANNSGKGRARSSRSSRARARFEVQ